MAYSLAVSRLIGKSLEGDLSGRCEREVRILLLCRSWLAGDAGTSVYQLL
jgi:hypothetical protein